MRPGLELEAAKAETVFVLPVILHPGMMAYGPCPVEGTVNVTLFDNAVEPHSTVKSLSWVELLQAQI